MRCRIVVAASSVTSGALVDGPVWHRQELQRAESGSDSRSRCGVFGARPFVCTVRADRRTQCSARTGPQGCPYQSVAQLTACQSAVTAAPATNISNKTLRLRTYPVSAALAPACRWRPVCRRPFPKRRAGTQRPVGYSALFRHRPAVEMLVPLTIPANSRSREEFKCHTGQRRFLSTPGVVCRRP